MAFPLGAALAGDPYSAYARSYQTATDQAGQQAAGNFLQQMFNAPIPGAQPTMMPPSPMPGQAPPPGGGMMQNLQRLPVVGPLFGGGQSQAPQGGPPAQAMAMPPQPQMQRPAPQAMPQGGGQNPIGTMTFPQIVQGLVRSNPGAPPAQIFSALRQMAPAIIPFMNADALAQYRGVMEAQGWGRIAATERGQDIRAQTTEQGQDIRRESTLLRNFQQEEARIDNEELNSQISSKEAEQQRAAIRQQKAELMKQLRTAPGRAPAPATPGQYSPQQVQGAQPAERPPLAPAPGTGAPTAPTRPPMPVQPVPGRQFTPQPPQPYPAAAQPQPQATPPTVAQRFGGLPTAPGAAQPPAALLTQPRGGVSTAPPQTPARAPAPAPAAAPAAPAPAPAAPAPAAPAPVQTATAAPQVPTPSGELVAWEPKTLAGKQHPEQVKAIAEYRARPLYMGTKNLANKQMMDDVQDYSKTVLGEAYDETQFNTRKGTEAQFASGVTSRRVTAINAVVQHFDVLADAAKTLEETMKGKQLGVSGVPGAGIAADIPALRRISSVIAKEFGWTGPIGFEAVRDIVSAEVVKAIVLSGGGVTDRQEAQKRISVAQSPAQLVEVMDRYKELMAGQAIALKQQYKAGGGRKDFDKEFLTPATRAAITVRPTKAEAEKARQPSYGGPQE